MKCDIGAPDISQLEVRIRVRARVEFTITGTLTVMGSCMGMVSIGLDGVGDRYSCSQCCVQGLELSKECVVGDDLLGHIHHVFELPNSVHDSGGLLVVV